MHRSICSKKSVAAAKSQSTHHWNNFEVSIDIIGTCPAHVAAYSHVTSTSGKTFQDCKKALVYSDFAKTYISIVSHSNVALESALERS